ncbi:barstar family protein [Phaeospirillum tilakii]|uniref:Barstar family protein n=1 Tax=Phaeospirillum tilakii TaxID=741673 RepID=A0ABW5CGF6_9PROT
MNTIEIDASSWRDVLDFYNAILAALGAPEWHGKNANALIDSVVYGGINKVGCPLLIKIYNINNKEYSIIAEIELLKNNLSKHTAHLIKTHGREVSAKIEIIA